MTNKEFFDTLLVSGRIKDTEAENIRKICDKEVYIGNLLRGFIDDEDNFRYVLDIGLNTIKLYNNTCKCEEIIEKEKNLLDNYKKYTNESVLNDILLRLKTSLKYQEQSNRKFIETFLIFSRVIWIVGESTFIWKGERYNLKHKISASNKVNCILVNEKRLTPIITIYRGDIIYQELDSIRSERDKIEKVTSMMLKQDINLMFLAFDNIVWDGLFDNLKKKLEFIEKVMV